jgi:hypothetical protein
LPTHGPFQVPPRRLLTVVADLGEPSLNEAAAAGPTAGRAVRYFTDTPARAARHSPVATK